MAWDLLEMNLNYEVITDNDIFDPNSNVVPYVLGLSRSVALGEQKYFVYYWDQSNERSERIFIYTG